MKWLMIVFILLPIVELALLIYTGQLIGLFPTMALILLTGIGGAYMAKKQGLKAWNEFSRRMSVMETPGNALIDSVCIFLGGVLLIIPGFLTDIVGLLLLFKWPRRVIRPFIHRWIYLKMKNGRIVMR